METVTYSIRLDELERNIRRLKNWTPEQRDIRLENLCRLASPESVVEIKKEVFRICYDENFFKRVGMNYSNPDTKLIEVALLDCLFQNR